MKTLITQIFLENNFKESDADKGLVFFERDDPFNEYYLLDLVEGSDWKGDYYQSKLDERVIPFFERVAKGAPDIYKNTSLIVCVRLDRLEDAGKSDFRRHSMSIEESPSYFRRYVIPYIESASPSFLGPQIQDIVSRKINDSQKFNAFSENGFSDPEYHLAMQLATKLPFFSIEWDENGDGFRGTGISADELELLRPKPSMEKYIESNGSIKNLDSLREKILDESHEDFFNALKQYEHELGQ